MKLSNICTLTAVIIGLSITMAPIPSHALSIGGFSIGGIKPADALKKVSETITSQISGSTTVKKLKEILCKKADAKSGIFSLRSGAGVGGKVPILAALGLLACKDFTGFNESGFYKNATNTVGDKKKSTIIREELVKAVAAGNKIIPPLVCKVYPKLFSEAKFPNLRKRLKTQCDKI